MSRLVEFQNRIRRQFCLEWLSLSQKKTYDHLQHLLSFQETVNLYGSTGVGKTFIRWVLEKEVSVYSYLSPDKLEENTADKTTWAVVDPHPRQRLIVRQTLATLHNLGYIKIILVSNEPVEDQIPRCQLALTPSDLPKIYQNWSAISIPVDDLPLSNESLNLHSSLRQIALNSLTTAGT